MKFLSNLLFILCLCFSFIMSSSAQKMSIQGTLKDINGKAIADNTSLSVTFKIYSAVTGGSAIWTETSNVAVSGGVYSHFLGSSNPLEAGDFAGPRWLGVTVSGSELTPRTELSYAPYALSVASAQSIANNTGTAIFDADGDFAINKGFIMENGKQFFAKNNSGTLETFLSPRWSDNVTYLNMGSAGFNLRNNGNTSRMFIKDNGDTGIGTTTPANRLDIEGGLAVGATYSGTNVAPTNGVIIQGNVGIGTPSPDAPLVIKNPNNTEYGKNVELVQGIQDPNFKMIFTSGQNASSNGAIISQLGLQYNDGTTFKNNAMIRFHRGTGATGGYLSFVANDNVEVIKIGNNISGSGSTVWFDHNNVLTVSNSGSWNNVALQAYGSIWADNGGFYATSDERIKKEISLSSSDVDLDILNKIKISNYKYKDVITNSEKMQKKVIAQQVKNVYPTAISQNKGIIPNVYEKASSVVCKNESTIIMTTSKHDFVKGDKVKLIIKDNGTKKVEVKEIIDNNTFVINEKYEGEIFVYGKEVDDLHIVDYDALSMLNISATQELYKRIVDLEEENRSLKNKNSSLIDKQTNTESRLTKIEDFLKSIKTSTSAID